VLVKASAHGREIEPPGACVVVGVDQRAAANDRRRQPGAPLESAATDAMGKTTILGESRKRRLKLLATHSKA
jgi:hypothetical protein